MPVAPVGGHARPAARRQGTGGLQPPVPSSAEERAPSAAAIPRKPSLDIELLLSLAVLAAAALLIAVASVVFFYPLVDERDGALTLSALVVADVVVFVAFGAYQLRRHIHRPLAEAVAATEAIANGDLARRVPQGATRQFAALSASVNRMTDRLLDEQTQRVRVEKLATVGRLAAGVAHEVGNPLGAIGGYAHLLRARVAGDLRALEALDGLERESARIDRIVRGLLDYARPRRLTPAAADLNDVVRYTVALLEDQGALRGLTLDLRLDPARPSLFVERHEIEQVLVNLLLNAADALGGSGRLMVLTEQVSAAHLVEAGSRRATDPADFAIPREPSARVRAWLQRAGALGDTVRIVVADSGAGVPPADEERIFDPFYTTKEPGKGTGLGLAIVARVVESLGGAVWVQRAREGGAAFVILVPVVRHLMDGRQEPGMRPAAARNFPSPVAADRREVVARAR